MIDLSEAFISILFWAVLKTALPCITCSPKGKAKVLDVVIKHKIAASESSF